MRALLLTLCLSLLPACVMKSTYLELEAVAASTEEELQARITSLDQRITELEADLVGKNSVIDRMTRDLTDAKALIGQLKREKGELQREKAGLVDDKSSLGAAIEEMERALRELDRRKQAAEGRVARFRDMLERFKSLIDSGTLRVKIVDGRMVVELATDVLFDSGKASLSPAGVEALTEVGAVLQGIPDRRYQVEGHTDDVPIKSAKYPSNWELASDRALTVLRAMVDGGLDPDRISAASYGEFKPTGTNETDEGRAANRRIEIVVVPDLSDLPGFEELQKL